MQQSRTQFLPDRWQRPVVIGALTIILALLVASAENGRMGGLAVVLAAALGTGVGWLAYSRRQSPMANARASVATDGGVPAGVNPIVAALEVPVLVIDGARRVRAHNRLAREFFPKIADDQPLALVSRNPDLTRALERAVSTLRTQTAEMMERLPYGRRLHVTITPLADSSPAGEPPPMLIQFRDIGEQDRLAQLRTDFIANASHELRTPLASIKGFIETLQGPAKADDAARLRFLGIMEAQAARMNRILDDLLSLSRIEMRAHLRPETVVEIVEIIRDALRGLEPLAREARITLRLLPVNQSFWVEGDRDELEQVFQNLVHNAIKYGHEGGRVDIAVINRVDPADGRDVVEVSVADDGPGIDAEHLPRLTERFYRVDTARSRERGGTGLGLAIVKHILNRHRGELEIVSELGRGSTFTILLDAAPAPPETEDDFVSEPS